MVKKSESAKNLKLTLVRSPIGRIKKHKDTLQSLGLRKMHHSVEVADIPSVRGKINQIYYMLKVEEV